MKGVMKTKIAVFDFDGTLYPFETFTFLVNQLKKQSSFRSRYYLFNGKFLITYCLYKLKFISKVQMREQALLKYIGIFKGLTATEIDEFFTSAYLDMKDRVNSTVLKELQRAKADGYKVIVVSGAVKPLLEKVSQDIKFDIVIGSEIPIRNDKFDELAKLEYIQGDLKVQKLKAAVAGEDIDWEASIAYADSESDLPILSVVGNPVCVDPDEKLLEVAKQRNWRII